MALPEDNRTAGEKLADIENEIKIFEDGVKTKFWQTLQTQWKPIVDAATGAALGSQAVDRSFLAGRANGLHNFLKYPEKHIQQLRVRAQQLRGMVPK